MVSKKQMREINTNIWFDSRMADRLLKILNRLTWGGSTLVFKAVRDDKDYSMVVVVVPNPNNVKAEKPDEWDEYQNVLHFIAGAVQFMAAGAPDGDRPIVKPLLPLLFSVTESLELVDQVFDGVVRDQIDGLFITEGRVNGVVEKLQNALAGT